MKIIILLILLFMACSVPKESSEYEKLLDYEGIYEYKEGTTIDISASGFDTTLYAVLDEGKYPLKHVANDSFLNTVNDLVVFQRDQNNAVTGYKTEGLTFSLITTEYDKIEMFPRESLYDDPQSYYL